MIIKLLIEGANMKPSPAIAQQLGPLGLNINKIILDVNNLTKDFKGMKIPIELDIDDKTKEIKIKTSLPPTAELLKKELSIELGSADHKNVKVANASIEDIIKIVKIKYSEMLEKDLKNAVKSILGTCLSLGVLVENENPKKIIEEVNQGKFDNEINNEITETISEKRKKLDDFFIKIKAEQDLVLQKKKKQIEEKKQVEEEKQKKEKEKEGKEKESKEKETPVNKTDSKEKKKKK